MKCFLQAIHVVLEKMEITLKRLSAPANKTIQTSLGRVKDGKDG